MERATHRAAIICHTCKSHLATEHVDAPLWTTSHSHCADAHHEVDRVELPATANPSAYADAWRAHKSLDTPKRERLAGPDPAKNGRSRRRTNPKGKGSPFREPRPADPCIRISIDASRRELVGMDGAKHPAPHGVALIAIPLNDPETTTSNGERHLAASSRGNVQTTATLPDGRTISLNLNLTAPKASA